MSEAKDPAIKLFGKTIPLPEISHGGTPCSTCVNVSQDQEEIPSCEEDSSSPDERNANRDGEDRGETTKDAGAEKPNESEHEDRCPPVILEESSAPDAASGITDNPKTPSVEKESTTLKTSKTEEEQSDTSNSQEKTLKKPDKILPCPRCKSMDTKFCYYNNYNVNQPRHFCKNCQRYWTAGGTMRNVPVGAGRRKNKNSSSHYRHLSVSEALQTVRVDLPNGVHHPALKANGTVLTFGSDRPLHESVASVLNLADKTMRNCTTNGFRELKPSKIPASQGSRKNGDDSSSGSSGSASNSKGEAGNAESQEPVVHNYQVFPPQIPCFPGTPWPYPWNSAQWSSSVPSPAFCPPGFPMPFYPAAAYWGCSVPGTWNVPWPPQPSSPNQSAPRCGPNSPTLGKHSRNEKVLKTSNSEEEEPVKENNAERCLWIPKTLRIDDPGEAAKSSIWKTLGIKNERADIIAGRGLFKPFQAKGYEKNHPTETLPVLQANPAALSRSLQFQESS